MKKVRWMSVNSRRSVALSSLLWVLAHVLLVCSRGQHVKPWVHPHISSKHPGKLAQP